MEEKKRDYSKKGEGTKLDKEIKQYFRQREESEISFFGGIDFSLVLSRIGNIISLGPDEDINESKYVEILKSWKPDAISVFGSSILKDNIIDNFDGKIINMHLGLSPYYRGSGTNFWPLYDEKPEYVGVTIHYLDRGVDSGKIIAQGRPIIEENDTIHSIGNKTIALGTSLMIETLDKIERKETIKGREQNLKGGKICKFRDCLPEHIIELENKFSNGLLRDYLERIKKNPDDIPKIVQFI